MTLIKALFKALFNFVQNVQKCFLAKNISGVKVCLKFEF